jgi:formamidopyrimidine-DNA glycosylase
MPELPEVETVRERLAPVLTGRRFERVEIADPRLTRPLDPVEVANGLEGERVNNVARRGKYLVVGFDSGRSLLIHLRMTGSIRHAPRGAAALAADPYSRAVVSLDDGSDVVYRDVRRFGTWLVAEPGELEPYLDERIGGEPLARGFTARRLADRLRHRRVAIKSALLDQRTFAGMGNIYTDEALWRARLHPLRPANTLAAEDVEGLTRAVKAALRAGIARQGATLRDYSTPDGRRGRMQHALKVYGRSGEPCERCGTPIEKIRISGRGTWYCPTCQQLEPGQAARRSSSRPSRSRRQSSV